MRKDLQISRTELSNKGVSITLLDYALPTLMGFCMGGMFWVLLVTILS